MDDSTFDRDVTYLLNILAGNLLCHSLDKEAIIYDVYSLKSLLISRLKLANRYHMARPVPALGE